MTAPDDPVALGLSRHRVGDLDAAERFYRAALARDPGRADGWHLLGLVACHRGRHDLALQHIDYALQLKPDEPGFLLNRGVAFQGLGRVIEAAESFRQAVTVRPDFAEAHNNLANALHDLGQTDEALVHWQRAIALRPTYAEAHSNLALTLVERGAAEQAIDHAQAAARLTPHAAPSLLLLGDVLVQLGRFAEAVEAYRVAVRLCPTDALLHCRLAHALRRASRPEEALAEAQEALRLRPGDADSHNEAAAALGTLGRAGEAEAHARQALTLRPGDPEACHNLAVLLAGRRQFAEAAALFRQALQTRPELTQASLSLARALIRQGLLDEAEDVLKDALARQPNDAQLQAVLGEVLSGQGFLAPSQEAFRQALRLDPAQAAAHSSLLMTLCLDPQVTPADLLAESRLWGDRHGRVPVLGQDTLHDRNPDRPLRIGYVSADLLGHVVVKFFGPVLMHHDRRQVEAFCYADILTPDAVTEKLRSLAAGWRVIHGRSDEEVAQQVRADRIDVLVDLAGHTGTRLGVFARRPSPVQVTWLGYPATTGLEAIHYRLTDAVADPPGEATVHTETLVRLPGCFSCYLPSADAPPVSPAPCLANGFVTFGSTHKLAKLNDQVLNVWADILKAVPNARLLVYRDALRGRPVEALRSRLLALGLAEERLELRCATTKGNHLDVYAAIDVLLDTWPWSGHATACEALWQGVPVLTLRGDRHAGRMVASVLDCVGLKDWIADTPKAFAAWALSLTGDLGVLALRRTRFRDDMRASALCDGEEFTRRLEATYRDLWRRYARRVP